MMKQDIKKVKHIIKEKTYEYAGMDCYTYTAKCSCGYSAHGWTPGITRSSKKIH